MLLVSAFKKLFVTVSVREEGGLLCSSGTALALWRLMPQSHDTHHRAKAVLMGTNVPTPLACVHGIGVDNGNHVCENQNHPRGRKHPCASLLEQSDLTCRASQWCSGIQPGLTLVVFVGTLNICLHVYSFPGTIYRFRHVLEQHKNLPSPTEWLSCGRLGGGS